MRPGVAIVAATLLMAGCGEPIPATLEFVGISPAQPRLGDIITVTFAARDSRGLPAEGINVDFRLEREVPGVTLAPTTGQTNRGSGEVTTQVIATGRVASIVVVADAGGKIAQSPSISIAGSEVSSRGITFQCGPIAGIASGGIHAISAYGPGRDLIAGVKLDCTAHVSDRNGDGIPNQLVSFLTEAGTVGPTAQSMTDVIGNAGILYKTSLPLPQDVPPGRFVHTLVNDATHIPQPLAPEWMVPWEWRANPMTQPLPDPRCQNGCDEPQRPDPIRPGRINNPRDNLVAMIAVTAGEEAFDDRNNNGVFDPDETFVDTVEPFVDANDNGTWDPGELYVDQNVDGAWTGKNGVYDRSTLIWAQERILWTGLPDRHDYADAAPPGSLPTVAQISPTGAINVSHFGGVPVTYRVSDPWFNVFAQNADDDGCIGTATDAVKPFPSSFGDQGVRLRYPPVVDIVLEVRDAHDPTADPKPAAHAPPVSWTMHVSCKTTASPNAGHEVVIGLGQIAGGVE